MLNDDGGAVVRSGSRPPARLSTVALPSKKIGKQNYQAVAAIVQSQHVTYQQKTHVFGNIAPTIGGTWDGYGTVFGGGGSVSSKSESVVQVVYCDHDDCENTAELPASISAREGSIMRLDFMNGHIFAAQNLSGKQDPRGLLGPADFISMPRWPGIMTFLTIAAILAALLHAYLVAFLLAIGPAVKAYDRHKARQGRKQLGDYMGRALTASYG